jgi:parallel beta-helix repeat protein
MARSSRWLVLALAAVGTALLAGVGGAHAGRSVVVGPGQSIQAAVDAARPGDTILVYGRHRENVAVTTDRLTLRGIGAVIEPPARPAPSACFDPTVEGEAVHGICVVGEVNFETNEVIRYVPDVTVSGFTVRGFAGMGIASVGARDATFAGNVVENNRDAGIGAIASIGTRMLLNRASGTDGAGFWLGVSPGATATLAGNVAERSRFGILVSDSRGATIVGNSVRDNCVGVLFLVDAAPTGNAHVAANDVRRNTRACAPNAAYPVPVSGVGVWLFGASGNTIVGNSITGNAPSGETIASGGVVVTEGFFGAVPADNLVRGNSVLGNDPDLFWDGTGTGNVFRDNRCRTSSPPALCR